MTNNTVLKRTLTALMSFLILITAICGFSATKASAAEVVKVISDEYVTAYINADGSGKLTLTRAFSKEAPLREVDGVPLKDIIKFNNGGYVEEIYSYYTANPLIYNFTLSVTGAGPSDFWGKGIIKATDRDGDTYALTIWSSRYAPHFVNYNSENPKIKTIEWCTK